MGKGRRDEVAAVSSNELKEQLVLKKQLGKGGFAAVFLGTYKGTEVAVKVLLPEHNVANGLHLKLMLREGQYMSRCTHRCIVKVHAVVQLPASFPGLEALGHRAATWALVMDYVPGGSVAQMLYKQMSQTHRAYSNYEAFCWARDVAEALAYLHDAPTPVVHRDIKADNVLLTTDPDTGRPAAKLMDFGLMATMDGRNPLLRRRSINPQPQGGEGALGRASQGSLGSLARGSAGGAGGGAAGSLAAPSVGTYYQDPTHEPSKIFYLVEELPASVVLALGSGLGPSSRAASLDMRLSAAAGAAGGGGGAGTGRTSGDGGAAADGGPVPPSGAATPLTSAISSAPSGLAAAAAALAAGPPAPSTSPAGGGGLWGIGGKGIRGGGGPGPAVQPLGALVPLNEEASYHGNTAGYASMLAFQQQQQMLARKQQQQQQGAPGGVGAGGLAAGGLNGLFGRSSVEGAEGQQQHRVGSMGSGALHLSLSHSTLHSAASSGHGGTGGSGGGGNRVGLGQSHSLPCSLQNSSHGRAGAAGGNTPASEAMEGGTVTPGAVRLRLSTEDGGQGPGLLGRQLSDKGGSAAQLSAALLPSSGAAGVPSTGADSPPSSPLAFPAGHQPANPPPTTASQTIAITNSTPTSDITNTSNTAAACQPHQPHLHLSSSSSLAGSPAAPASAATYTHIHNSTANAHLPPGSTLHSRRASCDAVPPVEGGASPLANQGTPGSHGGGGGGGGHNANGSGSETLTGATGTTATVSNASASRPQSLPQRQLLVQATAALAAGSGSGGGGSVTRPSSGALDRPPPPLQPPAVERTSSTKSIGSSRSLTGPPGAAAAAAGAMAGGGASLAKPSISTVLQGAYERDFQWVWRLTGQTGSCMYMAPEVFRNLPYNEKVDVFSFGVLLYEVFSRTLTLTTATNMRELRLRGMDTPAGYAAYVADGYRAPRPNAMPEALYGLICACWHQDPLLRPAMADVAEQLQALQDELARDPPPPRMCGCVMS